MIGRAGDEGAISQFLSEFEGSGVDLARLAAGDVCARVPGVRREWDRAVWEPSTADIDVGGLHAAYLRAARQHGADIVVRSRVTSLSRTGAGWRIGWVGGELFAHRVVNAAGAWADDVARMAGVHPIGITPLRRTMVQLEVEADVPSDLPLVVDINEGFYFKPEGCNRIWLSPHDETPTDACDAAPEELDIATAIDRFENVMDWPVVKVERSWAGLRSFAPDRLPVVGADPSVPGFYWCAGQGGFGIQTAPAVSGLLAANILAQSVPEALSHIHGHAYAPGRPGLGP